MSSQEESKKRDRATNPSPFHDKSSFSHLVVVAAAAVERLHVVVIGRGAHGLLGGRETDGGVVFNLKKVRK